MFLQKDRHRCLSCVTASFTASCRVFFDRVIYSLLSPLDFPFSVFRAAPYDCFLFTVQTRLPLYSFTPAESTLYGYVGDVNVMTDKLAPL